MEMKEKKKKMMALVGGFVGMLAIGTTYRATDNEPEGIVDSILGGIAGIVDSIFTSLSDAFGYIIDAIGAQIATLISAVTGIFESMISSVGGLLETIVSAPADFIDNILSPALTGDPTIMLTGEEATRCIGTGLCFPALAFPVIAVIVAGVGLAVIQQVEDYEEVPGVEFAQAMGVMLIILGAVLAVYGMFPEYSTMILGGGFGLVFFGGIWTYFSNTLTEGNEET